MPSPWDKLPTEIIVHIASYLLPFADLMLDHSYDSSAMLDLPTPFRDWSYLSRTCCYLHDVLNQEMYHQAARIHDTFFLAAVWSGSQSAVDRFLSAEIKTQRTGKAYLQALYRAVYAANLPMVQKIVGLYQLDENADEDRRPSLSIAAYMMEPDTLHYCPITVAAQQGNLEVVSMLVDVEPPPQEACSPYYRNNDGRPVDVISKETYLIHALHWACRKSQISVIKFLIERGADVNRLAQDNSLYTALHIACLCGDLAVVRLLLQNGAHLDARDARGCRPLHFATNYFPIVQTLVYAGADIQAEGPWGTALRWAIRSSSSVETVRFMLGRGMDPNRSWNSTTLLHDAVEVPQYLGMQYLDVLLEFGSNVFMVRNEEGRTPIELAMYLNKRKSVELLMEGMKRWACREEHILGVQQLQDQAQEWLCV